MADLRLASAQGIPQDANSWYRAANTDAMRDFMESGVIRGNPQGRYGGAAYYNSHAPLDRYMKPTADGFGGGESVFRVKDSSNLTNQMSLERAGLARHTTLPEDFRVGRTLPQNSVNRFTQPVEAFQRGTDGTYTRVYDNVNPVKRGLRSLAYNVGGKGLATGAEAVASGLRRFAPMLAIGSPIAAGGGAFAGTLNGGGSMKDAVRNGLTEAAHEATFGLYPRD